MTKKLLYSLFIGAATFAAATGQAQSLEETARLLKASYQTGQSVTASPTSSAQTDAEFVREAEYRIAIAKGEQPAKSEQSAREVNAKGEKAMTLLKQKFEPGSWQVTNKKNARRAAKAPSAMPDVLYAVEKDISYSDGSTTVNGIVTIKKVDDSHAVLYNLWGLADTLQCSYDLAAGTVSVSPAQIYNHSTYGPIWACSMDLEKRVYSTTTPITGTIAADGTITLNPWGVIIVSGASKGGAFGIYTKSVFTPTNATISEVIYDGKSVTNTDSVRTYPVYVSQTYDNELSIINFTGNGAIVKMRLQPNQSVSISPQFIFNNALYGPFNCYPANWAKSKTAQKGNITGTGTDTQISLGNYGVFCAASQGTRALGVLSATIDFAKGTVTYPTATAQDWTGDGSKASPFTITKVSQLNAFAEDVNAGNDYKDKYVKLGADLDMTQSTLAYTPVGASEATPFRGSFDGDGHTIMNLTIAVGAEDYQGLFGMTDTVSSITNLKMTGATITTGGIYTGTVAGKCSGTMTDITVDGAKITATNHTAAGVVGYFNGPKLDNCSFSGTINGAGENGGVAAVIAGYAVASHLQAHGTITVSSVANSMWKAVGGVAASTLPGKNCEALLTDSYSDMQISSKVASPYVGGVIGQVLNSTVQRSFNAGPITTVSETSGTTTNGAVGGVAGNIYGGNLYDCYNGNIVLNAASSNNVGGVVGYVSNPSYSVSTANPEKQWFNLSKVERCLNYGQVRNLAARNSIGVYGAAYRDSVFRSVYYDTQMVGVIAPDSVQHMELTTAQLTSGSAVEGLDPSVWVFTEGLYPRLKTYAETNAAYMSVAPVFFPEGDNVGKVRRTFTLSDKNSIYWKIYDGSNFVDESTGLKIQGNSVTVKNVYSSEMLVALSSADNRQVKMYSLATINPSLFSGSGTEADPYLIKTKTDLESLNEGISQHGQTFKGDFFKQVNDIDATGFGGIGMGGNSARQLNATYDGDGHAIHNLNINGIVYGEDGKADNKQSLVAVALFGFVGENGTVKNLTIASDCSFKAYNYASGVAAVNYGRIINCKNYAPCTSSYSYAAGVVALNQGDALVDGCYNAGHILVGSSYAAGIAAASLGTVQYSQNDGFIEGDSIDASHKANSQTNIAGIVANNGTNGVVIGNVNAGAIYGTRTVGGITTSAPMKGTVAYNLNYGTVERADASNAARGAIFSTAPGASYDVYDNYFDAQIGFYGGAASSTVPSAKGVSTSTLTSGKALEGFDADRYDWTAGVYPVIKAFKGEPAAIASRKMVVTFADGQSADDVYTDAQLYKASDLQWTLAGGKNFTAADGVLKVNLTPDTTSLRDVLTAQVGAYSKTISLRAMPNVFDGQGTAADPFQIKSKDDMLKLAKFTNSENYPFSGRYFKVLNDIDFDTTTYECVGVDAGSFNGDFDGNGMKFYNINNTFTSTQSSRGLFGNVGPQGAVHDLTLMSGTITGYRYNGAFVGNLYGKAYNLENHAAVYSSSSSAAGIAGYVKAGGSLVNCKNYGNVDSKGNYIAGIAFTVEKGAVVDKCENDTAIGPDTKKNYVAGIAIYNSGTIRNCVNKGTVSGMSSLSGIVAASNGGDSILYCHNEGEIISTGSNVAGILGGGKKSLDPVVITGCYNTALITAKGYLGGVAGRLYEGSILTDCYNTGDIVSTTSNDVGGVAGKQASASGYVASMIRCYNTGNVSSNGQYTGGVVGDNDDETYYEDCYNTGNVICLNKYAGGFAGGMSGTAVNCFNAGNVEANNYGIGGFGGIGGGTIINCFNLGDVKSTGAANKYGVAGGLWGYGRCKMYNSYNMGKVTGKGYVGGITGGIFSDFTLENVYNAGEIITDDASTSGFIAPSDDDAMSLTNVYYDADVNKALTPSTVDAKATGLSTRNLTLCKALESDTAFSIIPGMYPTLKAQAQNALANWFAAVPVVAEGEDYEHVRSAITIGTPEGTVWTTSDNLGIYDGLLCSKNEGEAWVTKTYGDYTKTYNLFIETPSGINDVNTDAAIVKSLYFTINGAALGTARPTDAGVYIVKEIMTNGKCAARKMIVK